MGASELRLRVEGHEIAVTNPAKLLFADGHISKRDLIDYYRWVGPRILPFLRERPIAMERYPNGIEQTGFFQKSVPSYFPDWVKTIAVQKKQGGIARHVICNDVALLVYLANQACITPHAWLSRVDKLEYPDQMVFDLDPSADTFDWVRAAALALKELLQELTLSAYVKSTGSRGLHVIVPLKRTESFESVRTFARAVATIVVMQEPSQRTLQQRTGSRHGRVFLDINRNAYAQTVAPPYAVRARPNAPLSIPLFWEEVRSKTLRPDGVTLRDIRKRLDGMIDPWADFRRRASALGSAWRKLELLGVSVRVPQKAKLR
ncbi:non-homologous end-joining DNA ligase [Rhodoplanes elegans]|uniref:non-homologous end-joining DNA ligase n=1 Tax=Rhodoplanes elegans TaxID=29408 RepID=UPI001911D4D0|nr:non-homologous end-joining DNA ligase [Rhodoplanes elegans]